MKTRHTYKYKKLGGGGALVLAKTYVEKHRVSFIYFIVDKIIILLSESFKDRSPYTYNCD